MGKSFDGLLREMKKESADQFGKDFSVAAMYQKRAFEEYKKARFTEQQAIRLTAELMKQPNDGGDNHG